LIAPSDEFYFDETAAGHACEFFAHLPHIKGRMAGKPFVLESWQRDRIIRPLFGWKRADGTRKYRTAYIEIPRKNGKSTLCAGIALYLLFCDKEQGAEVYSVAGTRDQALMVFDPACAMLRQVSWLNDECRIFKSQKRVVFENSFYRALAADAGPIHGTNPHGIIFDELHVQPDRELWDVLQTGRGERRQSLTIAITTAGYDRSSICWEQHEYARRVADPNDALEDDSFLSVIYGADPEDDWTDPEVWAKANPNLGVSIFPEFLQEECEKAKDSPAYENTFRRLYLNQWTEQAVRWMPMEHWDACSGEVDWESLRGRECYAGLDMSSTRDLTSMVLVFPDDGGYIVLPFFWAPKEAATKRDKQDRQGYLGWAKTHIELTEGSSIDQSAIRQKLWECSGKYDIRSVGFDGWNMDECYQQLLREGWPESTLVKYPQNFAGYNEPMKRTLELARERKLRHGGHPVLRWNASNVVAMEDSNGNLKPNKGKSGDKIDGFCAMLMGLGLALELAGEQYEFQVGSLAL
jgi:phage terminase large subunit-like protein